jgi:hypothetical protein
MGPPHEILWGFNGDRRKSPDSKSLSLDFAMPQKGNEEPMNPLSG